MRLPPIGWAAGGAWLTALALTVVPELAVLAAVAAGVVTGLGWLAQRRLLRLCAAAALAVALSVAGHAPSHQHPPVANARAIVQLTSAVSIATSGEPSPRGHADGHLVRLAGAPTDLAVTVLGSFPARSAWGDTLELRGRLLAPKPGVPQTLTFAFDEVVQHRPVTGILGSARELRSAFAAAATGGVGRGRELVAGLAIGDTSALSPELASAMRDASLSHLTAVSGANCAMVIAAVWALCAVLRCRRATRVAWSGAALAAFVALVTPQPSVLRAAVMASISLWALARGERANGLAVLAVTVLGLLAFDPWLSGNIGFALSVSATAGILLLGRPVQHRLAPQLGSLATPLAVAVSAQLACQPILLAVNPTLNVWSIPANVVAGWCAAIACVCGLVACSLLSWAEPLGRATVWLASVPADVIAHIALATRQLPGSRLALPASWLGSVLAVLALSGIAVSAFVRAQRLRGVMRAVALVSVCGLIGVLGVAPIVRSALRPGDWAIAACPVGQGDAFVVRSAGSILLIDTGPSPELLRTCLDALAIHRIDLLVLTHYDRDHVGGVSAIVGTVGRVLLGPAGDAHGRDLRAALEHSGAQVSDASRGMTGALGDARYAVLWPNGTTQPGNDSSVVLALTAPGLTSIWLGDLGADAQAALLRAGTLPRVDIVKVAHHGSADQDPELYATLHARLALIGVGVNRYGHPTPTLLGLLRRDGIPAIRTDHEGLSLVAPARAGSFALWTERGAAPEP